MSSKSPTHLRFLRRTEVENKTGLSGSTIYRLEKAGDFPQRRQLTEATVGWVEAEVENWLKDRERRFAPVSERAREKQSGAEAA